MTETTPTAFPKSPAGNSNAKPEPEAARKPAEAIKEGIASARDWAGDTAQTARTWAAERAEKVKTVVADEPTLVIGISAALAFAVGLTAGLLLGRMTAD
jgi:ElaB/YqjD/DUF883 family membrane-anchored ribosome-binding protein